MDQELKTRVLEFIKSWPQGSVKAKTIARKLNVKTKVVNAILRSVHIYDKDLKYIYRSPHNTKKKRPVWYYNEKLDTNLNGMFFM